MSAARGTGAFGASGAARAAGPRGRAVGAWGAGRARRGDPWPRRLARADPGDAGTVTAELALGMVAVVLVLSALLVTSAAVTTRMRCLDAARTAARVAVTGAPEADVVGAAHRVLPGSRVVVARDAPWLEVEVTASVGGAWFAGGGLTVSGSATAWVEPWGG